MLITIKATPTIFQEQNSQCKQTDQRKTKDSSHILNRSTKEQSNPRIHKPLRSKRTGQLATREPPQKVQNKKIVLIVCKSVI